jgi:heat shock protein HslJ
MTLMKSRATFLIATTVLIIYLLSACGGINPRDTLNGTAWTLTSIDNIPPLEGRKLSIAFAEGKLSGSSGCNSYSGSYEINGEKISAGPIAMTLMACVDPGVMDQEQSFLAYLGDLKTFVRSDGQLQLFRSDGKSLTFIPMG